MIISHDRYFMSQVANRIFSFENKSVERYDCDYHDFMNVKGEEFMAKVTGRYVEGDKYKVTKAKEVYSSSSSSSLLMFYNHHYHHYYHYHHHYHYHQHHC